MNNDNLIKKYYFIIEIIKNYIYFKKHFMI